jgi:hypothetical protein
MFGYKPGTDLGISAVMSPASFTTLTIHVMKRFLIRSVGVPKNTLSHVFVIRSNWRLFDTAICLFRGRRRDEGKPRCMIRPVLSSSAKTARVLLTLMTMEQVRHFLSAAGHAPRDSSSIFDAERADRVDMVT